MQFIRMWSEGRMDIYTAYELEQAVNGHSYYKIRQMLKKYERKIATERATIERAYAKGETQ